MDSLPQDLLTTILVKMPLKSITTSKLVCKQWKSIFESKFFYQLFQSHHQNSHSLWSLMCCVSKKEVIAHYGCKNWGLKGSLGSYISSFITSLLPTEETTVEAFSDVGLILIRLVDRGLWYDTYYVANPISREYVKIPPIVPCITWETTFLEPSFTTSGLVTQVEDNVILSYKIVLVKYIRASTETFEYDICLLIYSSETGLWSSSTIRSPLIFRLNHPVSMNGNLYWIGMNYILREYVLVYHNFYASGTESDRCRVIPFPDVEKNNLFRKVCVTSEGSLMYMKIVYKDKDNGSFERKLSVWKLKSGEWQIVSEISPDFMNPHIYHFQFTMNPFDAKTVYLWSQKVKSLVSINLDKQNELHNNFECSCDDGCIKRISEEWYLWEDLCDILVQIVFLPRWLYRMPCSPS